MKIKIALFLATAVFLTGGVLRAESGRYVNEKYGLSVQMPEGWFSRDIAGDARLLVKYTKYPRESRGIVNPTFAIAADWKSEKGQQTLQEFAAYMCKKVLLRFNFEVKPTETEVNGIPCIAVLTMLPLTFEDTGEVFYGKTDMYFFETDSDFITAYVVDRLDTYSENKEIFTKALGSLSIGSSRKTEAAIMPQKDGNVGTIDPDQQQ